MFTYIVAQLFSYLENGASKWQDGLMPEDEWRRVRRLMVWYLSCPGIRRIWWPETRNVFTDAFGTYVDEVINGIEDQSIERVHHLWLEGSRPLPSTAVEEA